MSAALRMNTQSASLQSAAPNQSELLANLASLAQRLGELEAGELDETAALRTTAEVTRLVQSALTSVTALERLDSVEQSPPVSDRDWEPETWVGVRTASAAPPRLGDVCFACSFELNIALRSLERARDYDARLAAVETARRKLYRAIHAIAQLTPDTGSPSVRQSLDQRVDEELSSSLAVRRLYAEFRQNLRRAEDDSSDAVLTALRYAAGALATLTASPHYAAVRVSDAALLRNQHARLLDWSRSGKPRAAGLQLLEDISTSASLLRDINRRQELRTHDTELIRGLLTLQPLERADWLVSLDRLVGLDDVLDRLAAQLRTSPNTDVVVDIVARLSALV
jgi:hypothetical protein